MSTLIVPFGRSNALVPPEAAQNVAIARYQMRTLQDLLNALAVVVPPAAPMLRTSAAHFAEFVGQPPDAIEIATLVDRKEGFRRYLKGRRYQVNSVRTFVNSTGVLVRKAEEFGWKRPEAIVPKCWQEICSLAPNRGCRMVIQWAIELRGSPEELNDGDLNTFCRSQHERGESSSRANEWLNQFRRWVRRTGLSERFPSMASLKLAMQYGLRQAEWPDGFKEEVEALLRWKQADFAPGRPRDGRHSIATAKKLRGFICLLAGYTVNIYGTDITTVSCLVTEEIISSFCSWSINERQKNGAAFKSELSTLHATVRHYPKYKGLDVSWFPALLKSIPLAPETEALDRKVNRILPHAVIEKIPGRIRQRRDQAAVKGARQLATLVRDEPLMNWLLFLPWRQRNLRECRVKGATPNLFKAPLPKSTLVARPRWVAEMESENPDAHFWQFRFTEKETKMGNRVHAILPRRLIGPLEEYLTEHRPNLLKGSDPLTLFVNRDGRAINEGTMRNRVTTLALRFAGAKMSPHVFRDAFAYEWLTTHPDDYLTVSKLLWHTNIQTTLKVYGARFNESSAVCRLDEWLEASATNSDMKPGGKTKARGAPDQYGSIPLDPVSGGAPAQ
jgi:hypothetical protein